MAEANHDFDQWRQAYHLMPKRGWLNDPNGAVYFKGTYHVYHQYVPDNPKGGATHWGHKTSKDLVHFKEEPVFLSPGKCFDKDGVYSGGAMKLGDQIHFFYTGNVKKEGDYDYLYNGRDKNVVHVVSSDGYSIDQRHVIIPHEDFPPGFTSHIRDPKVFQHGNLFYMILGGRKLDNTGAVLLFESEDLDHWDYKGNLLEGNEDQGYMWEAPDLVEFGDQAVLLFSPQGIRANHNSFLNPHSAGYLVGRMDWDSLQFIPKGPIKELDQGFDFYAPHTFDDGHRTIMWAWMGVSDSSPEYIYPTVNRGWQHCLTMPRLLELKGDRLLQKPLQEYENIRTNRLEIQNTKKIAYGDIVGNSYEFDLDFVDQPSHFTLDLLEDTRLAYKEGTLTLNHGPSGYGRRSRQLDLDSISHLQIFVDHSSLEIFVNHGEAVFSSRVFPGTKENKMVFDSDTAANLLYWVLELSEWWGK